MGEIAITKICPVCGKQFVILYPHLWAYRRGAGKNGSTRYYCSWKCIRELDKKEERKCGNVRICKEENEKEAIRIFLEGGDQLKYLEGIGIKAPSVKWYEIRQKLKDTDPELYAKTGRKTVETPEGTLADAMDGMKGATDKFFGACKEMGLKLQTPELVEPKVPKITKPLNYDGMTVRAVEGDFGTYNYSRQKWNGSDERDYIDYSSREGDELSMTVEQWRKFLAELRHAARILGVEL